jgi:hypothetical protein
VFAAPAREIGSMPPLPSLHRLTATLLPAATAAWPAPAARPRRFRLLVVGPAILRRPETGIGPWRVRVTVDGSLLPIAPRTATGLERSLATSAHAARLGAALLEPRDLRTVGRLLQPALHTPAPVRPTEFYGWAILYQLPGLRGVAHVDPHDDLPGMPAFYESPVELADRQDHLGRRGIPTRAIAVVTQRVDFERGGAEPWNRYCPLARWRRACGPAALRP